MELEWEKPELIDLTGENAFGSCKSGSVAATGSCGGGAVVSGSGSSCSSGGSATGCNGGGSVG